MKRVNRMKLKESMISKDAILVEFRAFLTDGGYRYITVNNPTEEMLINIIKELSKSDNIEFFKENSLKLSLSHDLNYNSFSDPIEYEADGSYNYIRIMKIKVYN